MAIANIDNQTSVNSGLSCTGKHPNTQPKKEQIGKFSLLLASALLAVVYFCGEVRAQQTSNVAQTSTSKEVPSTIAQVSPPQEGLASPRVNINDVAVAAIVLTFAYAITKNFK